MTMVDLRASGIEWSDQAHMNIYGKPMDPSDIPPPLNDPMDSPASTLSMLQCWGNRGKWAIYR